MGNDSSVSSSVYGLNESLSNIEERLFRIEDIHLHHQTCFNADNCVLISGKKIKCSRDVHMITGPILGLVGSQRASIMIEVDKTSTVTFNIFRSDKYSLTERFVDSKSTLIPSFKPTVSVIDNLVPGVPYTVYIGGIDGVQTVHNPAKFVTVNENISNSKVHSCHFGVKERSTSADYRSALTLILEERKSLQHEQNFQLISLGNSVCVTKSIDFYFKNIWESLSTFDGSDQWLVSLSDFERTLQDHYRSFYAVPEVAELCSTGAFLPIGGCGESGRLSVEFILQGIQEVIAEAESRDKLFPDTNINSEKKQSGAVQSGWASKRIRKMQDGSSVKSSVVLQTLPAAAQSEIAELNHSSFQDISEKVELQKLLLFLIASIVRSVFAQYFRQLWDSQFPALKDNEDKIQFLLKNVLTLRSKIWKQNRMIQQLTLNQKKYLDQFHSADSATEGAIKVLQVEMQTAKQKVVNYLQAISDLGDTQGSWSDPKHLALGSGVYFVLCDCEWHWLEHSLELKLPLTKSCTIPETAIKKIKELLTDAAEAQYTNAGPSTAVHEPVKCVICIIPKVSLDPHSDWLRSLLPMVYDKLTATANIALADKDFRRLLLELSSWQRRLEERCALLICGGTASSSNEIFFNVDHEPVVDEKRRVTVEECVASRDTIRALVAGRVCSHDEQLYSFLHQRQWMLFQRRAKPLEFNLDAKRITVFMHPSRSLSSNGVWNAQFVPRRDAAAAAAEVVQEQSSYFSTFDTQIGYFTTSTARLRGMMVGRVTDSSCTILVEAMETSVVTLICEDSLTGLQYCMRQMTQASVPSVFHFTNLEAARHYRVYNKRSRIDASREDAPSVTLVSFTTWERFPTNSLDTVSGLTHAQEDHRPTVKLLFLATSNFFEISRSIEANASSRDSSILINSLKFGSESLKKLSILAEKPWNGIDTVIHSRCPVDLQQSLPRILSLLHLVDAHYTSGDSERGHAFLAQAQQALRESFRTAFFSDATYSRLFRSGGNYVPSVSAIDVLRSCGYSGVDVLYRELTPSVAGLLLNLLEEVSSEYSKALWLSNRQSLPHDGNYSFRFNPSVLCFELHLDLRPSYGNEGRVIPTNQLSCLQRMLLSDRIETLIIVSPIPIFERQNVLLPSLDFDHTHMLEDDVISVADICLKWVMQSNSPDTNKSVLFICSSSSIASPVNVVFELNDKHVPEFQRGEDVITADMFKSRISKLKTFQQLVLSTGLPDDRAVPTGWKTCYKSKLYSSINIVCETNDITAVSSAHTVGNAMLQENSLGFLVEVCGSDVRFDNFDTLHLDNSLSSQELVVPRSTSSSIVPELLGAATNGLCQSLGITGTLHSDTNDEGNMSDTKQFNEVMDSVLANNVHILEKYFQSFAHGFYCDVSSSIVNHIHTGLLSLCHDILDSLDPTLQEFISYPSILGIRLAWTTISKYMISVGEVSDDVQILSFLCTKVAFFTLFVKLAFLSRVQLDYTCRDHHIID